MNKVIFNLGVATLYQDFTSRLLRENLEFTTRYKVDEIPEVSITVKLQTGDSNQIGKPYFAVLYLYNYSIMPFDKIALCVHIERAPDSKYPEVIRTEYDTPEEAWEALTELFAPVESDGGAK